jgi:hypothetical protein
MIDSALARQRAAMLREQVAAESAVERAQVHFDDPTGGATDSVTERLKATEAHAAAAHLGVRAAEEQQALRFDLVDPGRIPPVVTREAVVVGGIATFALALLAGCLVAGAWDPRVVAIGDLSALGIPALGRLPVLPDVPGPDRPPAGPAGQADREAQDPPSPPGDDSGPRV